MRGPNTYAVDKKPVPVELLLADRRALKGKIWIAPDRPLIEALNAPQAFIEFTPYGDERTHFICKSQIVSLATIEIPQAHIASGETRLCGRERPLPHPGNTAESGLADSAKRLIFASPKPTIPIALPASSFRRKLPNMSARKRRGSMRHMPCLRTPSPQPRFLQPRGKIQTACEHIGIACSTANACPRDGRGSVWSLG